METVTLAGELSVLLRLLFIACQKQLMKWLLPWLTVYWTLQDLISKLFVGESEAILILIYWDATY
jgi:hypothetical protein